VVEGRDARQGDYVGGPLAGPSRGSSAGGSSMLGGEIEYRGGRDLLDASVDSQPSWLSGSDERERGRQRGRESRSPSPSAGPAARRPHAGGKGSEYAGPPRAASAAAAGSVPPTGPVATAGRPKPGLVPSQRHLDAVPSVTEAGGSAARRQSSGPRYGRRSLRAQSANAADVLAHPMPIGGRVGAR